MDPLVWAKRNKKRLLKNIIGKAQPIPQEDVAIAIFAAGLPGAGKTEFLDRLLARAENVVCIDLDKIVELFPGYTPETYYKYRQAAARIVDDAVIYCRKHRLDFVLDGTFATAHATSNIESALKRHKVQIFYIWKDPLQAWQHTKDRQLVTKRGIDKAGFIEAYINIPKNIAEVREHFDGKIEFAAIRKNPENDGFQMTEGSKIIDDLLKNQYTKEDLERILT